MNALRSLFRRGLAGVVIGLALLPAGAVRAGDQREPPRAFLDGLFTALMEREEIPGLAVVLIAGDEPPVSASYGWADREKRIPVDVDRTVFPLGSISKVLTTVAVLQQVEKGTINLDTDIRHYLGDVKIDHRFAEPIVVRHLLTHTDGFDVRWLFGGATRSPSDVGSLSHLVAHLPPRIEPPGQLYLYSDVGMVVAGSIVERVSGETFADYMERHVFQPLGMPRTTFDGASALVGTARATGYDYDRNGQLRPVTPAYSRAVPASGALGTVADLAVFTKTLLQTHASTGTGSGVLAPSWLAEMSRRQFTQAPFLPGTGYGLYECYYRGYRALVHGGLSPGFTSFIMVLPEQRIALCVAANEFNLIGAFEHDLFEQVIDHLLPAPGPALTQPTIAAATRDAVGLAGDYRCDQYSRYSTDKLAVLAGYGDEIHVVVQPDGRLRFDPAGTTWRPLGGDIFEDEKSGERVAFRRDGAGRGARIVGSAQFMSYQRLRWFEHVGTQAKLGGLLLSLTFVGAAIAARNWLRRAPEVSLAPPAGRQASRALALTLAVLVPGYLLALVGATHGIDFATAGFGEPALLRPLSYVPVVFAALAAVQVFLALRSLCRSPSARNEEVAYAFTGFATLLLLPMLAYWNLLPVSLSGWS